MISINVKALTNSNSKKQLNQEFLLSQLPSKVETKVMNGPIKLLKRKNVIISQPEQAATKTKLSN